MDTTATTLETTMAPINVNAAAAPTLWGILFFTVFVVFLRNAQICIGDQSHGAQEN